MTNYAAVFLSVTLFAAAAAGGAESDFRLAGILTLEDGRAIALIESPDGEQKWFREGESISDGSVTVITARSVTLEVGNQTIELRLAGSSGENQGIVLGDALPDPSEAASNPVHPDNLLDVKRLAADSSERKPEELAMQTLAYLSLPPHLSITAVNDQPVDDPKEALRMMADNIGEEEAETPGFKFVVSVSGPRGVSRVYIFSDENSRIYSP